MMFSFAISADFYWTLHFFHLRGGSGVGLSQNASICSFVSGLRHIVLYLFCACFCYARAYYFCFPEIMFYGDKSQLNCISELATQDQNEKQATEFELEKQKYKSSTYKQNVIK